MKNILQIITIFLISTNFIFAQEENRNSIHKIEYLKHYSEQPVYKTSNLERVNPLRKRMVAPDKEVFGYLPYWASSQYLRWSHISTLAYFGLEFDRWGNIIDYNGWPPTSLINTAHNNGVRVVVVAINFNPDDLNSLLNYPDRRENFINNLIAEMKRGNADGVNIDFEFPYSSDRDSLTSFMAVLAERCHTEIPGSHVSIASPAVNWSNTFDYKGLADVCDALMIMAYNYWWNGSSTSGPVSPLSGSNYNVTRTVNDYLQQTLNAAEKLILGLPYYGIEWQTINDQAGATTTSYGESRTYQIAAQNAANYGRRWSDLYSFPWYAFFNNNNWFQCWYEDSLSLSYKYNLVMQEQLAGIGIWALGYDGARPELWGAIEDHFFSTDSFPPSTPTHFAVISMGNSDLKILFHPAKNATSYQLFSSSDGVNFVEEITFSSENSFDLHWSSNSPVYFKLRAKNTLGISNFTEVLAATSSNLKPKILVVNGFDRVAGTMNTFDFIRQHGPSLYENGQTFSSASNEAIVAGEVSLLDFDFVDWILGEEGTSTESFSNEEQILVQGFLENGKSLFVSGSEIGYDLVSKGSQQDVLFYQSYLKATYIVDDALSYTFSGASSSIFSSISFTTFDNGTNGGYNVDYPDGIKPTGGSLLGLVYGGVDYNARGGAGIYYQGTFGQSSVDGKLVHLAFPFEMIVDKNNRNLLMQEVLQFVNIPTNIVKNELEIPEKFLIVETYPNPIYISKNSILNLSVQTNDLRSPYQIVMFNSLGQQVKTISLGKLIQSPKDFFIDIADLSSGLYFIKTSNDLIVQNKRIIILR